MSFLLDTNLLSEIRKGAKCDRRAWAWFENLPLEELYISVMTTGEIRKGAELCRRKDASRTRVYEKWLRELELEFSERILPINAEIADIWGRLTARGAIPVIDGLIAATAAHHGLTVATRNAHDFQRCGVDYFNPFEA